MSHYCNPSFYPHQSETLSAINFIQQESFYGYTQVLLEGANSWTEHICPSVSVGKYSVSKREGNNQVLLLLRLSDYDTAWRW